MLYTARAGLEESLSRVSVKFALGITAFTRMDRIGRLTTQLRGWSKMLPRPSSLEYYYPPSGPPDPQSLRATCLGGIGNTPSPT